MNVKAWSLGLGMASLAFFIGCAPGLEERLEDAQAYSDESVEETDAFFATNAVPLTLTYCRDLAHERTLKLTQAKLNSQLAHLQSVAAFSAFLPQVNATYLRAGTNRDVNYNFEQFGLSARMMDRWSSGAALTISQPVFAPNAWLLWLAAKRGADLQKLVEQRNEELLDVQVATLFYQAAVAARTVEAYDAQQKASEELYRQVKKLQEEDLVLEGDAARVEAQWLSDGYNAQIARDNAQSAKANLLDLLNFYPLSTVATEPDGESLLEIRERPWATTDEQGQLVPCDRETALTLPLEEWLWSALVNRKELWANDLSITLYKVKALAALAHFLPTLSVSGGGLYTSSSSLSAHRYLTGGVGGVMSVFDGFVSIADYLSAKEQEKAAYTLREDAASTLMVSVWQAWTNWRQARERVAVAEALARATEVDYRETFERYQQDQETLSTVLDKFSTREQARISALSATYAEALAEVVFRDTIGLGWGDGVPEQEPLETRPLLPKE